MHPVVPFESGCIATDNTATAEATAFISNFISNVPSDKFLNSLSSHARWSSLIIWNLKIWKGFKFFLWWYPIFIDWRKNLIDKMTYTFSSSRLKMSAIFRQDFSRDLYRRISVWRSRPENPDVLHSVYIWEIILRN